MTEQEQIENKDNYSFNLNDKFYWNIYSNDDNVNWILVKVIDRKIQLYGDGSWSHQYTIYNSESDRTWKSDLRFIDNTMSIEDLNYLNMSVLDWVYPYSKSFIEGGKKTELNKMIVDFCSS